MEASRAGPDFGRRVSGHLGSPRSPWRTLSPVRARLGLPTAQTQVFGFRGISGLIPAGSLGGPSTNSGYRPRWSVFEEQCRALSEAPWRLS